MSKLTLSPRQSEAFPVLTGTMVIPAGDCQYPPAIKAMDLLKVDFDCHSVGHDGLYLVEILNAKGVEWRGCRRFQKKPDLHIDVSGNGEWRPCSLGAGGMRVAGYVEQVYKPA